MSYTIGDGMVSLALAGGILGYLWLRNQSRQKKIEIIHQERMAAMEKGIPLPEFPLETVKEQRPPDINVITILGTILFSLSVGTMIVLYTLAGSPRGFWVTPLPFAFMGVGLLAFRFLKADSWR